MRAPSLLTVLDEPLVLGFDVVDDPDTQKFDDEREDDHKADRPEENFLFLDLVAVFPAS
jgi:hypothetical protein